MNTLLLDLTEWDLVLDTSGNIAMATNPYSIAQDVASAVKLFKGELWYNTASGIPYFQQILGQSPPESLIRAELEKAAMTVPEVVKVKVLNLGVTNQKLSGTIEILDKSGQTNQVAF